MVPVNGILSHLIATAVTYLSTYLSLAHCDLDTHYYL
jgi:hypothetical protein